MEERNESLQRVFAILRIASVYVFLCLLMIFNAASLPMFDLGNITPYFLLMGIYYWTLTRPTLMPFYLVFLLGLGLDVITGQLLGLNALAFLIIAFVLHGQRRFLRGQSWPVLWVGYGLACALVAFIHMVVFILVSRSWPGLFPFTATVLISVLAYPIIVWPMMTLNKFFRHN